MLFVAKILIAGTLISFCSWLAGKRPELAGFIIALPLTSLLALAFSYSEFQDPVAAAKFARSIFVAVPMSLLFFEPFIFAERTTFGFWGNYAFGLALLTSGYFIHRYVVGSGVVG